uniref:NTR domain-containing protein n=1 Tax=Panagrolaimus sp. PS1159 TaxID=55785 RepID=A0AC35FJ11_9BILA
MPDDEDRDIRIYCSVDWIAEVKIIQVLPIDMLYEHEINYTKVYKMPSQFNETFPTTIYSHQQSSACGLKIPENTEDMLVGFINDNTGFSGPPGTISIDACTYFYQEFKQKLKNGLFVNCTNYEKEQ